MKSRMTGLVLVAWLVLVVASSGCSATPSSTTQPTSVVLPASTSTTAPLPANDGPLHDFLGDFEGEGYAPYKLDHVRAGVYDATVVWVRVEKGEGHVTYERIYDHASRLAGQYGIASDDWEFLRVVLVEATSEREMIESRDFYFSPSVMSGRERKHGG